MVKEAAEKARIKANQEKLDRYKAEQEAKKGKKGLALAAPVVDEAAAALEKSIKKGKSATAKPLSADEIPTSTEAPLPRAELMADLEITQAMIDGANMHWADMGARIIMDYTTAKKRLAAVNDASRQPIAALFLRDKPEDMALISAFVRQAKA